MRVQRVKGYVTIVRVLKDVRVQRVKWEVAILRVRKCDVTLLMTVVTGLYCCHVQQFQE